MNDVMLDLETLGTGPNSVIISVGACFFDKELIGDSLYLALDRDEQIGRGREVSAETVTWWNQQSLAAREVFAESQMGVNMFLQTFSEWLLSHAQYPDDIKMWGNGSDFDNAILADLYRQWNVAMPWKFYNNRCYRTLKNIAIAFDSHDLPEREGVHHHALHDAEYQAAMAGRYLKGVLK